MREFLVPGLAALFAWWFSTGVILLLNRLPQRTYRYSLLAGTVVLLFTMYGLIVTSQDTSVAGAYLAFACGLAAWGYLEMTFLLGFVTGPRRAPCPKACSGWRHFRHGIEAILYHELAIIAGAAVVLAMTWEAPNQIGAWTFLLLWVMRQSAKLNLFLGVPNTSEDFLPDHLRYLGAFFRRRPMNLLFPLSVTGGTVAAVMLVMRAVEAGPGSFESAGLHLLAALMVLALLEHWLMVLPLRGEALWSFGVKPARVESAAGLDGHRHEGRHDAWPAAAPPARAPIP